MLCDGFDLAVSSPSDRRGSEARCIIAIKDNKMGSIPTWIDLVYIISSFLLHYSVFHELNTLDACWIAVNMWSNSGRCRQESVYLSWMWCLYNDHHLGYRHDYMIFYQLPNSNLFTHHVLYSWEKSLVKPTPPGSTFPTFPIYLFSPFVFRSIIPKPQKYLAALFICLFYFVFLCDLSIQSTTI